MAEPETELRAFALRAVLEAQEPYAKDLADVKRDLIQIKQDRERDNRYADQDRVRLAASLKDESERNAEEIAEKVINRMMISFGLDPQKPADFVRLIEFVRGLQETMKDARKHGFTVIVGLITMALATGFWTLFKGSILK